MDSSGLGANAESALEVPKEEFKEAEHSPFECGLQPLEEDIANRHVEASERNTDVCNGRRGWRKLVRNFNSS
jgi:hypothetical protein